MAGHDSREGYIPGGGLEKGKGSMAIVHKFSLRFLARTVLVTALAGSLIVVGGGCSKTAKGGVAGGIIGGALGGLIGHRAGSTAAGVIIGAVVGGAAGAAIGRYMDKQAEELSKDLKGAKVERVGEGIKITFPSGILFNFDSSSLTPTARGSVDSMAKTLNKYKETNVLVQGYTDSIGSASYNQQLSERRAAAVIQELIAGNVDQGRLKAEGYGEEKPVADNATQEGRAENRRVEIAIWANDKLKKAAEQNGNIDSIPSKSQSGRAG
jgi:outer membrane protein OmpA-like peptidoglycan-associated protein